MDKKVLRRQALSARRSLSKEEVQIKSRKIEANLFNLSVFLRANLVLFYLSLPEEVQTYSMIQSTLERGKRVAVPVIADLKEKEILPCEIRPGVKLVPGPLGVPQPESSHRYPVEPESIDLVIVPGVAFDKEGGRVGFGAGFYDRFLGELPPRSKFVALAFECQLVDRVPREEHDMCVDCIVTEKRLIDCGEDL